MTTPAEITLNDTTLYDAAGSIVGRGHSGTYAVTATVTHTVKGKPVRFYRIRRKGRTLYVRTDAASIQPGAPHPTGGPNVPPATIDPRASRFVAGFLSYARGVSHRINVSPWVILAQWAVETGWGTSDLAAAHNLAGIRWYGRPGQRQVGGTPGVVGTGFAAYRSIGEFCDDYAYVMNLSYYAAVRRLWDPSDTEAGVIVPQCRALGASPWDAGHYKGGTTEIGHALTGAWHLIRPVAAAVNAKGPNA